MSSLFLSRSVVSLFLLESLSLTRARAGVAPRVTHLLLSIINGTSATSEQHWSPKMRSRTLRVAALSAIVVVSCKTATAAITTTKEVATTALTDSPALNDALLEKSSASIMGESALVDKETGRIFWEGGSTTLSASFEPFLAGFGVKHMKATVMSCIFLLAIVASIVAKIRHYVEESFMAESCSWPLSALLLVANWTILRVPKMNGTILLTVICLYLMESYTCSTRRYLANAISSPTEVEEYIERIRHEPPVVTWKVRCFHYERRKWLYALSNLWALKRYFWRNPDEEDNLLASVEPQSPWLFSKKVVTHETSGNYTYASCVDKTTAGVWRRQSATSANPAPFTKIVLSKLLILSNTRAREDYFQQQVNFVTREGRGDEFAEFSTSIQVHGFRRRMLAVRPVEGVPSAKLFRLHLYWMFTLMGLTVPFRIWFARHCDELRVTVAKETSTGNKKSSPSWSWRAKSTPDPPTECNEHFKAKMRELALYAQGSPLQSKNETKSYEVSGLIEGKSPDSSAKQETVESNIEDATSSEMPSEAVTTSELIVENGKKDEETTPPLSRTPDGYSVSVEETDKKGSATSSNNGDEQ